MATLALGTVQLAAPKGTLPHRSLGWLWSGLLATVAVSSFWIHGMRWFGPFGPIHILSLFVIVSLPLALLRAHRGDVTRHARARPACSTGASSPPGCSPSGRAGS
ncbi:hypothetical protein [Ancylobacter vacuolatus]|uniref:hypothetical protein n=1 Tax=Ancylobacter vacuolatus TaxID=223389 RepID=UPI0027D8AFC4|nr:hypothetical protein [Ancylobacter vacuolatus]